MRKLAWTALGFTVGVGLAEYVLPVGGLPYIAAALAVLSAPALLLGPRVRPRAVVLLLSCAAGLFLWWGQWSEKVEPYADLVGETVQIEARVTDYVERHADYERVEVRVTSGVPAGKGLLYAYEESLPELEPGDVLRAEIRVTSAVERGGERSRIYTAQGQFLLGYITPGTLAVTGRAAGADWLFFPQRLSRWVEDQCDRFFDADTAPLVKGLLTGNTLELREDVRTYTAMRMAGVVHIVAVSGMHLFILVGFVQLMLGKGRRTSLICIPVIAVFTLMAGCRASVVRAAVMQSLVLLAPLFHRESDGVTGISAALLLLLVVNPMAVGGAGLQMSFACMAGFVLLMPGLLDWMEKHLPMEQWPVGPIGRNMACSLCAMAFSAPVAALYYGEMPLWGPVANVLTLLVVEAVFACGYAACLLGAVWAAAGRALGWLLDWAVRWCLLVYRTVAALPVASLSMGSDRAVLWLAGTYGLFLVWYLLRRRGRRIPLDIPVCVCVTGLCLVLAAGKLAVPAGEGLLAVLDVGQGQCVVLAGHEGTVVVDCGGSGLDDAGDVAANYLQTVGRTGVDALVLTHLHQDHADGVVTLLSRMRVGTVILPAPEGEPEPLLAEIEAAAEQRGVPVTRLTEEARFQVGDVALELRLPQGGEENEQGLVVLATVAGRRALIMGDAGRESELALLREGALGPADVLVAGHHGSSGASGALMLLAVRPETAVVSVGYNNYGQPAEDALARLDTYCGDVRRTDREGSVVLRFQEDGGTYGKAG